MTPATRQLARQIRPLVAEAALNAGACHIGSALSIVDVLAVLYGGVLEGEPGAQPHRFLLSKGHAASALYATLAATGVLSRSEVLDGFCADGGRLHGHPERGVPGVEMTAGSLGHGPAIAVGLALAERHAGSSRRTICLVGDGECNEGSVWEALSIAGQLDLGGLTLIVDANGLQGLGATAAIAERYPLAPRLSAVGFAVCEVDGHDHDALHRALTQTGTAPAAVVARTVKARGWRGMEGDVMSHYRPLSREDAPRVLAALEQV